MKRPHIVHMTSVHEPFDNRIFKQCKSIAAAECKATLIVASDRDELVDGVHIKAVPSPKTRRVRITRTVWQIFRLALRADADIYQFHDPELIPVGLLLRAFKRKVVYDVHENVALQIADKPWIPRILRGAVAHAYELLDRATVNRWSAVVTANEDITRRLSRIRESVTTIQNYAELDEFARSVLVESDNHFSPILIDCGGVSPRTSTRALIDALSLLPDASGLRLIIAGPVDAEVRFEEFQTLAGWKRVEYRGAVSRTEMIRLMSVAGIALILYRNSPNSHGIGSNRFFEALAAGLPVIAPNFPQWQKMVETIGCGLTVDPMDPKEIAKAICCLVEHPEEAKEMGRRGRKAALENFNWTSESSKLLNLYRGLLRDQPAANRKWSRKRNLSGMS